MLISPSELEIYSACPQRLLWSLDSSKSHVRRSSLSASLGSIAHAVLAQAHKGRFSHYQGVEFEDQLESVWLEFQAIEFGRLKDDWSSSLVPEPMRWPRYFSVKTSTQYLVKNLIFSGEAWDNVTTPLRHEIVQSNSLPWIEKYLSSEALRLKGVPDLVLENSEGLTVVDYKTGLVDDPSVFSMQLHVYFMLVNEFSDRKVTKLAIRDFSLRERKIDIDLAMVTKISVKIEEISHYLEVNRAPAKPSLESCRYCVFKGDCEEFKRSPITGVSEPLFIEGEVLQIHALNMTPKQTLQVRISKAVPSTLKGDIWISGLSFLSELEVGNLVEISGNLHMNDDFHIVGGWNSIIRRI